MTGGQRGDGDCGGDLWEDSSFHPEGGGSLGELWAEWEQDLTHRCPPTAAVDRADCGGKCRHGDRVEG